MYLIHRSKHRKSSKNEKTEEYASNERTSQNLRKKKQITKLPAKHFKLKKKKKINDHRDVHQLEKKVDEFRENFNKEIDNIRTD